MRGPQRCKLRGSGELGGGQRRHAWLGQWAPWWQRRQQGWRAPCRCCQTHLHACIADHDCRARQRSTNASSGVCGKHSGQSSKDQCNGPACRMDSSACTRALPAQQALLAALQGSQFVAEVSSSTSSVWAPTSSASWMLAAWARQGRGRAGVGRGRAGGGVKSTANTAAEQAAAAARFWQARMCLRCGCRTLPHHTAFPSRLAAPAGGTWEVLPEASGVSKQVVSFPKGRLAMKGEMLTASTRLQTARQAAGGDGGRWGGTAEAPRWPCLARRHHTGAAARSARMCCQQKQPPVPRLPTRPAYITGSGSSSSSSSTSQAAAATPPAVLSSDLDGSRVSGNQLPAVAGDLLSRAAAGGWHWWVQCSADMGRGSAGRRQHKRPCVSPQGAARCLGEVQGHCNTAHLVVHAGFNRLQQRGFPMEAAAADECDAAPAARHGRCVCVSVCMWQEGWCLWPTRPWSGWRHGMMIACTSCKAWAAGMSPAAAAAARHTPDA